MDRKQLIAELKGRSTLLFPETRATLTAFIEKLEASPADNTKKLSALKKASLEDTAQLQEFNRLRTLTVENLIVAASNAASFFRKVNLEADEEPMIENTTGLVTKARVIGEDGKPHMTQAFKSLIRQLVPLNWVSTDILEYPLVDIYKGPIAQDVLNAVPLSRDFGFKIDALLWKLVQALPVARWNLAGKPEARTFVLHPNIIATNVPDGNLLDMHTEGAFNFNVVKGIVKWFMQMSGVFPDGPTVPEVIFVPSIDTTAFIDQIDLNSRGDNPAVQQIFTGGYVMDVGGKAIVIVGDATIDPAAGIAYVRTNKPIGEWYTKSSLDINWPNNSSQIPPEWVAENKGKTFMKKPFGAATPLPWTINMLAVMYK